MHLVLLPAAFSAHLSPNPVALVGRGGQGDGRGVGDAAWTPGNGRHGTLRSRAPASKAALSRSAPHSR